MYLLKKRLPYLFCFLILFSNLFPYRAFSSQSFLHEETRIIKLQHSKSETPPSTMEKIGPHNLSEFDLNVLLEIPLTARILESVFLEKGCDPSDKEKQTKSYCGQPGSVNSQNFQILQRQKTIDGLLSKVAYRLYVLWEYPENRTALSEEAVLSIDIIYTARLLSSNPDLGITEYLLGRRIVSARRVHPVEPSFFSYWPEL